MAGCPRAPPTSRGRPSWPARARGIQVTDPAQMLDIHTYTPLSPLVRAELLRAAVVVQLRGRGAAHQPRLQQVLPGGVGQQQRVPLQHRRPGHHQQIEPRLTLEFSNCDIDLQYLHVKIFTIEGSAFTWNWDIYICLQRFSSLMVCPIIFPNQQTACR